MEADILIETKISNKTILGPDIEVLLKNQSNDKMKYSVTYIPDSDCKNLTLDNINLNQQVLPSPSRGEILAGEFVLSYFSLAKRMLLPPCDIKFFVATVSEAGREHVYERIIKLHKNNRILTPLKTNLEALKVEASYEELSNNLFKVDALVTNTSKAPIWVGISDISITCRTGDLHYNFGRNFLPGINSGGRVVLGESWAGFSFALKKSPKTDVDCSVEFEFIDNIENKYGTVGKLQITHNKKLTR